LLADPEVDAIYNPLPNHLHVPWSIRAAEAGKHVLCEKPIALSVAETRELMAVRDRTRMKIGEAFMVRTHPQWLRSREIVRSGEIGELRSIMSVFAYYNRDPENVRNVLEWGGGALMDIGCYPIQISRFLLGEEPRRVLGLIDRDREFRVDHLTWILDFPSLQSVFTCSMQMVPAQRVDVFGTKGRLHIDIPFNAPPDRPCRIAVDPGKDVFHTDSRHEELSTCDQYTIQGDHFARAILENTEVPTPLEDSIRNMAAIEAIFRSAESGRWEQPEL
jgi:predicted dehydrogenase